MDNSDFCSNNQKVILEQYKIYVEMADRVSHRRSSANVLFLSLNTFVAGWVSTSNEFSNETFARAVLYSASLLLLMFVNYFWYRLIYSYRQLNTAKYKVIGEIEKKLPLSPYWEMEWKELGYGKDRKLYSPLTSIEVTVPLILIGVYFMLLLIVILSYYSSIS